MRIVHVDDAFVAGTKTFLDHVTRGIEKDFQIGSRNKNELVYTSQHIKWQDDHINMDQEVKSEELEEIIFDKKLQDNVKCNVDLHTQYRSVLGKTNWLQARTQFQSCYAFNRCASMAAGPTMGDVRALNKLVRKIRAETVSLRFWPLGTSTRFVGYPDAAYRNNADSSSQRGLCVFLNGHEEKRCGKSKGITCGL